MVTDKGDVQCETVEHGRKRVSTDQGCAIQVQLLLRPRDIRDNRADRREPVRDTHQAGNEHRCLYQGCVQAGFPGREFAKHVLAGTSRCNDRLEPVDRVLVPGTQVGDDIADCDR